MNNSNIFPRSTENNAAQINYNSVVAAAAAASQKSKRYISALTPRENNLRFIAEYKIDRPVRGSPINHGNGIGNLTQKPLPRNMTPIKQANTPRNGGGAA